LALTALAERQAGDLDAIALLRVQRDRAARAPDEIAGMRGDHKARFASIAHEFPPWLAIPCAAIIALQFPPARSPQPISRYRPSTGRGFLQANWPWPRCRDRARVSSGRACRAPRAARR